LSFDGSIPFAFCKKAIYFSEMNAQTKVTADGTASIPKDVLERMHWTPGTELEVNEGAGSVTVRVANVRLRPKNTLPRTTTADLRKWKPYDGTPKTIEEISSLSEDALRQIFAEQERNARN
jgi:bifunctional DNA-binding transcriptional regulator/antitoxin component of YhaV-PrlF toxin-antitoxin module